MENLNCDEKDLLLYGLPCIEYKGRYFVFSPYSRKCLFLSQEDLKNANIEELFKKNNLLGVPCVNKCGEGESKLVLITTTDCNLRCGYCFAEVGIVPKVYMDIELAEESVKHCLKSGTKKLRVLFHGGEPTLVMPIIKHVVEMRKSYPNVEFDFQIITNGVFNRSVADYLLDNDFIITLSADGIPEVQNTQRPAANGGPSDFISENIEYIAKRTNKLKILSIVTEFSVNKMPESVKYFANLGVEYLHFEPLNASGKAASDKTLVPPNADVFVEKFLECLVVAKEVGIKVSNSAYLHLLKPTINYCGSSVGDKLIVGPTGDLSLCYEVHSADHALADYFSIGKYDREKKEFLIDKEKFDRLKQRRSVENFEQCRNCFAKYICSGGCPNRNIVQTQNDFSRDDNLCKIKKSLVKAVLQKIADNTLNSAKHA